MAVILDHIDKIARDLQRDVLYVEFDHDHFRTYEYEEYQERKDLMEWLDQNGIKYRRCGEIARENGWESYRGQLYIDLPFDESNETYQLLDRHLCTKENAPTIPGVILYYLTLEIAMKNAHHDEHGFWDNWAENF